MVRLLTAVHSLSKQVNGDEYLSHIEVFEGLEEIEDDPRTEQLSMSKMDENIKNQHLIRKAIKHVFFSNCGYFGS